jgi:plastocyanin
MAGAIGLDVIIQGKTITFADVSPVAWYATYIRGAAEAGIVNGYKDKNGNLTGKFGPGNSITIAEALKIGIEGANYDVDRYANVIASGYSRHWASAYVSVAKGEHFAILSNGTLNLDRSATRAEVASIFTSAFQINIDVPVSNTYSDVDATVKYGSSIEALTKDEVVSGDTDVQGKLTGTFRPTDFINRAEVTKIVMNARTKYGEPGRDRSPSVEGEENLVMYTNDGYSPSVLKVKVGEAVTFRNDSNVNMWTASDPHPTHTNLSAFDANKGYLPGTTYMYTFTKVGTFAYHNHLRPSDRATIVVE